MGDKYEVLNMYQNAPATPARSTSGSPAADITPLVDPEAELLRTNTDLSTKKFKSESRLSSFSLSIF